MVKSSIFLSVENRVAIQLRKKTLVLIEYTQFDFFSLKYERESEIPLLFIHPRFTLFSFLIFSFNEVDLINKGDYPFRCFRFFTLLNIWEHILGVV